jgi:hypothetical protein
MHAILGCFLNDGEPPEFLALLRLAGIRPRE